MAKESALSLKGLDPLSRERMEKLLDLELGALSEADVEFLIARRGYLTEEQKKEYGITEANVKKRVDAKAKADAKAEVVEEEEE